MKEDIDTGAEADNEKSEMSEVEAALLQRHKKRKVMLTLPATATAAPVLPTTTEPPMGLTPT
jgi:hypothetical protein